MTNKISAYETLQELIRSVQQLPYKENATDVAALTDGDVFDDRQLTAIATVFHGLTGKGAPEQCFSFYPNRDSTEFLFSTPHFMSNGQQTVLVWGGVNYPIANDLPVLGDLRLVANAGCIGLAYGGEGDEDYDFMIPFNLKADTAKLSNEKSQRTCSLSTSKVLMALATPLATFSSLYPWLELRAEKVQVGYLLKESGGKFGILSAELRESAPREEGGEKGHYWYTVIKTFKQEVFLIFLDGGLDIKAGDVCTIADKRIMHDRLGVEITLGATFAKLADLALGTYDVTRIEPAKGAYGGYNLYLADGLIVGANSKLKQWIALQPNEGRDVSASNPAELEITGYRELGKTDSGKRQVICFMRMKKGLSLLDKIKAKKQPQPVVAIPPEETIGEPMLPSAAFLDLEAASETEENLSSLPW